MSIHITNPLIKYVEKPTRSNAIKAKCVECMGCTNYHLEPGFREEVRNCTSTSCPLYRYRPYQRRGD